MKTVLIKGPVLSKSGYGEHARFIYRAMKSRPDLFDVYVLPINWGQSAWILEETEETKSIKKDAQKIVNMQQPFDISLQVTIPNEWEPMAHINIGITAGIETNKVSALWLQKANQMDKIIVVSEHAKRGFTQINYEAFDQTGQKMGLLRQEKPIDVVGYPWKDIETKTFGEDLQFSTEYNFLTISQWGPRKNIQNTLEWFVQEFLHNEEVGLVIKTHHANMSILDRRFLETQIATVMQKYPDRKCKIHFLHGNMTEEEVHSLYVHPQINAYLTATHGEGFGLPIFEAAYSGLPVICPGWSGQMDFLRIPRNKGDKKEEYFTKIKSDLKPVQQEAVWENVIDADSEWSYADEKSFKKQIRKFYEDKKYAVQNKRAKKLQDWIRETFTEEAQNSAIVNSVLGYEAPKQISIEDIPKISLLTSVYKGDEYIEQFLEDITNQTIFEEKCELVIVNADSPGNEEEVINKYLEKYPNNIVYKRLRKDPGIYGVWNEAIRMSSGEFLTNANLDDRKAPNSLEEHAKALVAYEDVDLVYSDMLVTDKPNETFENNSSNGRKYETPEFSFDLLKMINMPHAAPLWRKTIHEKYGFFDEQYRSAGDWELWLRAASQGAVYKKLPFSLNLYYFNPTGISTSPENFTWKKEEEKKVFETYKDVAVEKKES